MLQNDLIIKKHQYRSKASGGDDIVSSICSIVKLGTPNLVSTNAWCVLEMECFARSEADAR